MTSRRTAIAGTITAVLLGLTSAAAASSASATAEGPKGGGGKVPGELWKRTELYFGGNRPDGSEITPAEFEAFLDQEVTPDFPDGLTWIEAHGQWQGGKEDSYQLIILYPFGDKDANRDIEEIRTDYRSQFQQQSVLRADSSDLVSF